MKFKVEDIMVIMERDHGLKLLATRSLQLRASRATLAAVVVVVACLKTQPRHCSNCAVDRACTVRWACSVDSCPHSSRRCCCCSCCYHHHQHHHRRQHRSTRSTRSAVRVVVVDDERGVSGDRLVLRARQIGEHMTVDGEMLEDHAVLGERACLVREQVLDLAQVLAQVGRVHLGRLLCLLVEHSDKKRRYTKLCISFKWAEQRSETTKATSHSKNIEPTNFTSPFFIYKKGHLYSFTLYTFFFTSKNVTKLPIVM